ncbi:hypothetical protein ES705_21424 [subsurface metagenome]
MHWYRLQYGLILLLLNQDYLRLNFSHIIIHRKHKEVKKAQPSLSPLLLHKI